jgi:predicted CXXCH cytochrome family protein
VSARARIARLVGLHLLAVVALGANPATATAQALMHNCSFCHELHGGSSSALTKNDVIEDLCDSCHDFAVLNDTQVLRDGVPVTVPQNGYDVHYGAKHEAFGRDTTSCWDCHNHEGEADGLQGTNLSMIQAKMITPAGTDTLDLIFKSRGSDAGQATLYSFADGDEDGDGDYTGVCEVCHTETGNHQNGLNLPDNSNHAHERGRTCSDCHAHDKGFAGGGPCASCHDTGGQATLAGRRAIMPELARVSHHVGSSYVDDDCKVCHDQSKHQQGNVRLWDVDSPDTLTSIVLTGNPLTNSAEAAKLSTFCLKCHDADGAGGSVPFSDLVTPPEIDGTAWAASSHEGSVAIVGCFGNGTFGCHASAHGSEKLNLLAPADVAPNATTLYEEEEGFCFNCHDADGPASYDAQAGYSTSVLWADDVTQDGPPNQNDRHDVLHATQDSSNVKIECYDCHDPHTANASSPPFSLVRTDPDPTDGRVPGTGWFADSAAVYGGGGGTSTDAISEFCLDCHDGSLRPGVLDNRTPQVFDILHGGSSWYGNSHGAGPSGASLKTGTNYWALDMVVSCVACHQAHPDDTPQQVTTSLLNNLFMINDTIHGTDFSTVIPSDGPSYELTTLTSKGSKNFDNDEVNSYYLCNTCHSSSMGSGKANCSDCHTHGDNRF